MKILKWNIIKATYHLKIVWNAKDHLIGEKNGNMNGKMSYIVQKNAKSIIRELIE